MALTVSKWRSLTVLHERYVLKSLYEQLFCLLQTICSQLYVVNALGLNALLQEKRTYLYWKSPRRCVRYRYRLLEATESNRMNRQKYPVHPVTAGILPILAVYPNARICTTVYARETATLERPFRSVQAVFFQVDKKPQ